MTAPTRGRRRRALLGAGMLFAGVIVWLVAQGPVMLGYDEALRRADQRAARRRQRPDRCRSWQHDRATLAGRDDRARRALHRASRTNGLARWEWVALHARPPRSGSAPSRCSSATATSTRCTPALTLLLAPAFVAHAQAATSRAASLPARSPDLHDDGAWRRAQTRPTAARQRRARRHRRRPRDRDDRDHDGLRARPTSRSCRPRATQLRGDRPAAGQPDRPRPRGLRRRARVARASALLIVALRGHPAAATIGSGGRSRPRACPASRRRSSSTRTSATRTSCTSRPCSSPPRSTPARSSTCTRT